MRIVPLLLAVWLLGFSTATAQEAPPALQDSLKEVLENLVAVSRSDVQGAYAQSRPFLTDSVSCIGSPASLTHCPGPESEEVRFSDTLLRARLVIGQHQGWRFDWKSMRLIADAPGLAVAVVRWGTEPSDTTVAVHCDPQQPAKLVKEGLWTIVFQRGHDDQWKVKHAHESAAEMTRYRGCPPE